MTQFRAIGIDLAKRVFHIVAVNRNEKVVLSTKVTRSQLVEVMRQMAPTIVFMEACGSSHYWARQFQAMGHQARLIAGQRVKCFVGHNKNDEIDAKAIVTAGLRPDTRFVSVKSPRHLELQALHRVRSRLVRQRTALTNEIRGLLYEHGFTIPQGKKFFRATVPMLCQGDELTPLLKEIVADLYQEYLDIDERVAEFEKKIKRENSHDPMVKKLEKVPGIGPLTASAIVAEVADPHAFKSAKGFASFLGLVPRHTGSGGKVTPLSLSKRGDTYIRYLLIHGARSVMRFTSQRDDRTSQWCEQLRQRAGDNKAAVALANKNARIIWKLLTSDKEFELAPAS
jgi:transposase